MDPRPRDPFLGGGGTRRILCAWFPHWSLQRRVAAHPELEGCPIILVHRGARGQKEVVAACSKEASRQGVRPGMPLTEAVSLFAGDKHSGSLAPPPSDSPRRQSGNELRVETHDPLGDRECLRRLAAWCHQFSPLISLDGDESEPDSLCLDITPVAGLFGGEAVLCRRVLESLRRCPAKFWGPSREGEHSRRAARRISAETRRAGGGFRRLRVHLAVAGTHSAAWALARYMAREGEPLLLSTAEARTALARLPIEALRAGEDVADQLRALGIHELGQLEELPRAAVSQRLGADLLFRWDQLRDPAREAPVAERPPREFCVERSWDYPLEDRLGLEHVLGEALRELAAILESLGQGANTIACRFGCPPHGEARMEIGFCRPSGDPGHWLDLARMHLERLALPGPAWNLGVQILSHEPLELRQRQLFEHDQPDVEGAYEQGVLWDRLAGRLGRENVVRPHWEADAQPEMSFRYESLLTDTAAKQRPRKSHAAPGLLHRPLCWRHPPPLLETVATISEGPPLCFHWQGKKWMVHRHWGPERIETGWWRGRDVGRDYYRVETTTGHRYWIFRDRASGRWFLHGCF